MLINPDLVIVGKSWAIDSLLDATNIVIPPTVNVVYLGGYNSYGDGGAVSCVRVDSEPSHPGKFMSLDGSWFEYSGNKFAVECFGAIGDCPDVTNIDVADQSTIVPLVTAATNDILAFQNGLRCINFKGGGRLTFGDKWYRLAPSANDVWALVSGSNTILEQIGGGGIQWDSSLNNGDIPSGNPGDGRQFCNTSITTGDPNTLTVPMLPAVSSAIITEANSNLVTDDTFVYNVKYINIVLYQSIRTEWQDLTDIPNVKLYRQYGFYPRFVDNLVFDNCQAYYTTNSGIGCFFSRNVHAYGNMGFRCGYGAILFSAQNNFQFIGGMVVSKPSYNGQNFYVNNNTSYYARDEGLSYGLIKGFHIYDNNFWGDHDAAVEGDNSYFTTSTQNTLGYEIPCEGLINNNFHDGIDNCCTGSIESGTNLLTVNDSFYLASDGDGGRYINVPGASSTGWFLINSVDRTNNIITLATNASSTVANVQCFTMSRSFANSTDGNQGRITISNNDVRNVFGLKHLINAMWNNNGNCNISNNKLENVVCPSNFRIINVQVDEAYIEYNYAISAAGDNSTGMIGGLAHVNFSASGNELVCSAATNMGSLFRGGVDTANATINITNNTSYFTATSPIRITSRSIVSGQIYIAYNEGFSCNITGDYNSSNFGYITFDYSDFKCSNVYITNNYARFGGGNWSSSRPITQANVDGGSPTAGNISSLTIVDNDFNDTFNLRFDSVSTRPYSSFDNSSGVVSTFTDYRNKFWAQRTRYMGAIPVVGTYAIGDIIENTAPAASSWDRIKYYTPGTYGTLSGITGSIPNGSTILTLSSTTGLAPQSWVTIAGLVGARRIKFFAGNLAYLDQGNTTGSDITGAAITLQNPVYGTVNLT